MKKKVIQIAAVAAPGDEDGSGYTQVFALTEDGEIWTQSHHFHAPPSAWQKLIDIPYA